MLGKELGNSRCHCLHIIVPFKSNFNQAKRILIGRKVTHHMADKDMTPSIHLTKTVAAFMENNSMGAHDRLINNILLKPLDQTVSEAQFQSICDSIRIDSTGISFIDDSALCTTSD